MDCFFKKDEKDEKDKKESYKMFKIDWGRYYKLMNKPLETWTDEEREFCKMMYHMEEVACGLDGD